MIRLFAPFVLAFGVAAFGALASAQEQTPPTLNASALANAWWIPCRTDSKWLTEEQREEIEKRQALEDALFSNSWELAVQDFLEEQDEYFADFLDDLPARNTCSFADPTQWKKESAKWRDADFAKERLRDLRAMECRLTDLLRSDAVPYECFSAGTSFSSLQCSQRVRTDVQRAINNLRTAMRTALLDLENLIAVLPTHIMLHCLSDDIATMQRAQQVLANAMVPVHACFNNRVTPSQN